MTALATLASALSPVAGNIDVYPDKQGFRVTLPNGHAVSIVWRTGTYSDGKTTVEVAAWDENAPGKYEWSEGAWLRLADCDDVAGWQTPEQVRAIVRAVAALPAKHGPLAYRNGAFVPADLDA